MYSRLLPSNKIGEMDRLPDFRDIFLRYHDGDGNENVKKAIRWIGRKTTVHAFFTLFCIFLYRHYMTMTLKCLISRFTGDVNKRRRNFLSLSELEYGCLEFGSVRVRLHFTKYANWTNRDRDIKNANLLFRRRFRGRRRSGILNSLIVWGEKLAVHMGFKSRAV